MEMTVKRLAPPAAFFWIGAFLTGLMIDALDVYWIGHPSPSSESALFEIQAVAVLVTATVGAILYFVCLVVQKSKFGSRRGSTILLSVSSGAAYSAVLGLSGQGVLVLSGGTTSVGWILLFLLPIGLSVLMRSSRFHSETSSPGP